MSYVGHGFRDGWGFHAPPITELKASVASSSASKPASYQSRTVDPLEPGSVSLDTAVPEAERLSAQAPQIPRRRPWQDPHRRQ